MSDVDDLKKAKECSDNRQYSSKHQIIKQMMMDDPEAFFIDSDDGKGIVGVTHKKTGFRFHMPIGKVRPGLSKEAAKIGGTFKSQLGKINLGEYGTKAVSKTVDYLYDNPRVEETLRKMLSYNLVDPRNRQNNMLAGALAGAVPGAVIGYSQSADGRGAENTLQGAAIGAVAGKLAGRYGPRATQAGLGRILTNLIDPHIYDGEMHVDVFKDLYKQHGLKGIIKSIVKDKPLHDIEPARHALFRDFFGLKRFDGSQGVITDVGRGADGGKISHFNLSNSQGSRNARQVDEDRLGSLFFDYTKAKHGMKAGEPALTRSGALGNFVVQPDGAWEDTWDFALHPDQKLNGLTNLLRGLVSPFGTPTTLTGKTLSEAEVLRNAVPGNKFNLIHDSYTTPVLNRAIRGSGANPEELVRHVKGMLRSGEHAPFMNTLADKLEGKPYNLLHSLAAASGVPAGDMRVMLGGSPRAKDLRPTPNGELKFSADDMSKMFHNRIPGSTAGAVRDAIRSLNPTDAEGLRRKLNAWSGDGRQAGGEVEALASTLGFAPEELPILLQ